MSVFDGVLTDNRTLGASESRTATFNSEIQNNDKAKGIAVVVDVTAVQAAVNEVQLITVDATGGDFTVTFEGQTTGPIAYNAIIGDVETALRALSTIGGTAVAVTGTASNYTVTFQSTLAATDVAMMTTNAAGLTGGASTAVVTLTTPGFAASSLVVTIRGSDPASGKAITLLTSAAITTVSTNTYRLYPGLTAVANLTVSDVLPKTFGVRVTAGNASPTTYSVGALLLA